MKKIVYKDGERERVLKGEITDEDTFFITLKNEQNTYRVNKNQVILIKDYGKEKEGDEENGERKFN